VTDVAAGHLGVASEGMQHRETYADAGDVTGRIVALE
jgi:hypothetical protein